MTSFGPFAFSLTDNFSNQSPYEVGAGMNGSIAVVTSPSTSSKLFTCPNRGTSWTDNSTPRKRVDITASGRMYSIDAAGNLYDGSLNISNGITWADVGAGASQYIWGVTSGNAIFQYDTVSGTGMQITGASATRIDAGPGGKAVIVNTAGEVMTYDGTAWTNIGKPGGANAIDVSEGPDGKPWAITTSRVYNYSGTAWVVDPAAPSGQQLYNISVGPDNQPLMTGYFNNGTPLAPYNLFKRLSTGNYTTLDVDPASSTIVFYNAPTGSYSGSQTTATGWSIADLYQLGGGAGSTTNQNNATASIVLSAGTAAVMEVVNVNCTQSVTPIGSICGSGYLENFGTGANPYGGSVPCGQTMQVMGTSLTGSGSIEDGEYELVSNVSAGGNSSWVTGYDHTSGDGTGNMMLVNADYTPGVFFNRTFSGFAPGATYDFSAWIANILKASAGGIPVNITFQVSDPATGNVVASTSTGNIANSNTLVWKRFALNFTATTGVLKFQLINNAPGGGGNDLVLDDITVNVASDHGDAPDSYGTLANSPNGSPCHIATPSTLRIGALLDSEPDGFASGKADGDDLDGLNDDDGIATFAPLHSTANSYSVSVAVTNAIGSGAKLGGWIDFNNNGVFDNGEYASVNVPSGFSGSKTLTWNGLSITPAAFTYGRFRLTTGTLTAGSATGTAPDGEVEDYRIPLSMLLSGTVRNDANGMQDGLINGPGVNAGGLFANLIDSTGKVIGSVAVNSSGAYAFPDVIAGSYTMQLSTAALAIGSTPPGLATLPSGWVSTGDGIMPASDGLPDGKTSFTINSTDLTTVDFGIERTPVSTSQFTTINSPGVNTFITMNGTGGANSPGPLKGSDAEDMPAVGSLSTKTVAITSLPTNGSLWYGGQQITTGADGINPPSVTNPFVISNYTPASLQVQFTGSGYTSTSFNYSYTDAAGKPSAVPATYSLNWTAPLPVVLVAYHGSCDGARVHLDWESGAENNVSTYRVEASTEGITWKIIAETPAIGTAHHYTTALDAADDQNLYRLHIVGIAGDGEYTASIRLNCGSVKIKSIDLSPNPNTGLFNIAYTTTAAAGAVHIRVVNAEGRAVYTQEATAQKGINLFPCHLQQLPNGLYYVVITDEAGTRNTLAFRKGE